MNRSILQMVVRRAEAMAAGSGADAPGDGLLLCRFVQDRDNAAFGTLLARHAPMVWGVCRGLLPCDADAEDAFQATFLALLRGAKSIRETKSIAPWLHGTATRIAKKSRLANGRRNARERKSARHEAAPVPVGEGVWDQAHLAVHEEIAALPVTLRTAFVLCVLEGDRHHDAAAKLGVPIGTVSARVSRARQKLLDRLNARGIALAAMVSALVAGPSTVPAALLDSVRLSVSDGFATAGSAVVHLATTALTETGGTTMKTKLLAAAVMIAGAIGTTGGSAWINKAGGQSAPPAVAPPTAPRYPVAGEPVPGAYQPPTPSAASTSWTAPPSTPSRAAWEHMTVTRPNSAREFQAMLRTHTNDGWEYVGSETFQDAVMPVVLSVFKRPRHMANATTPATVPPTPNSRYTPSLPSAEMYYPAPATTTTPAPFAYPPVQPGPGVPRFDPSTSPVPYATPSVPRTKVPPVDTPLIPSPNVNVPAALQTNQQTKIVKLKILAAADVAAVITQYLQAHQLDQKRMGVVAESVSNSLLITTPDAKSMDELVRIIGELDAPPMSEPKPAAYPSTRPAPATMPSGTLPKPPAPTRTFDSVDDILPGKAPPIVANDSLIPPPSAFVPNGLPALPPAATEEIPPVIPVNAEGVTEVVQLRYIAVADAEKSLTAYLKAQPMDDLKRVRIASELTTNSMAITGATQQSVKAILKLVRAMDAAPEESNELTPAQKRFQAKEGERAMIPMKHADAVSVAKSIEAAWTKDKRAQDITLDIAADATSNSIYIASPNSNLFKEIRGKIQEADKPAKPEAKP